MGRRRCHCSLSAHITLLVIHFIGRKNENEITISFIRVEMRKSKSKSRKRWTNEIWLDTFIETFRVYENSSGSRLEVVSIFYVFFWYHHWTHGKAIMKIAWSNSERWKRAILSFIATIEWNSVITEISIHRLCGTAWYFIATKALAHCAWVSFINENELWLLISFRKSQFNSIEGVMFQRSAQQKISKERARFSCSLVSLRTPHYLCSNPASSSYLLPVSWVV